MNCNYDMVLMIILIAAIVAGELLLKRQIGRSDHFEKKILNGHIELRKEHNAGLLFGMFQNRKPLPAVLSSAVITVFVAFLLLYTNENAVSVGFKIGVVFLLGGSMSNVLDRLMHGYVLDYICFCKARWRKFRRLVFNLADFCIFIGAVLIVLFD